MMSGLGHVAVGLALKPAAPGVPAWALIAAAEVNEIVYFACTLAGVEQPASVTYNLREGAVYTAQGFTPWSHGVLMSLVWTAAVYTAGRLAFRSRKAGAVLGLAAASHILLDLLMHAGIPLAFEGSPLLGLGLENSGPGFLFMTALDLVLTAAGLVIFFKWKKSLPTGLKG